MVQYTDNLPPTDQTELILVQAAYCYLATLTHPPQKIKRNLACLSKQGPYTTVGLVKFLRDLSYALQNANTVQLSWG